MRVTGIVIALVLGLALAVAVGAATVGKASSRPAAGPPARKAIVSQLGLEGLSEVYVQVDLLGDEKWLGLVGLTKEQLRGRAEERLRKITGIKLLKEQSVTKPRVVLQVVGHVIPGYDESDPPTATNLMVAVAQPVTLNRPGPGGKPVVTSGMTMCTSILSTRRASATRQAVEEKIAHLLDGFEEEYLRANAKAAGRPPA